MTGKDLPQIDHPVWFVFKDRGSWKDLFDSTRPPEPVELIWERFRGDPVCTWIIQAYVQLKRRGLNVHLTHRPVPGCINVIGVWHIGRRDVLGRSYNVVVQADCGRPGVADHVIVQNPGNVTSDREHLVQHWPQPGLVPRDTARGDTIRTLVYRGPIQNLWPPLRKQSFRNRLRRLGVKFVYESGAGVGAWHDYREADLAIAMRNITCYDDRIKPASKLANAWLAGVPSILGPESAYQSLRRDSLDYVEARSVDDVIDGVRQLKENPELYRAMRERAIQRAVNFTPDAVSQAWRDVLSGPVSSGYRDWVKEPRWKRELSAILAHVSLQRRHRRALKDYMAARSQGPRILDKVDCVIK